MNITKFFKMKRWSPWTAGIAAGVAASISIVLTGKTLGVSGGFETIASMIANSAGFVPPSNAFFNRVKPPVFDSQLILLIGIFAGALLASLFSGDFKVRTLPDNEWKKRFGVSKFKRAAILFTGCFLMATGAGIAGGCTSGLGISATMLLSPAGFLFIAGVFASGIITILLIYGRK
ncbi:YeeE/YedE thiosulfate transporter family protein [Geovibrio sp. ADMFC3]